MDLVVRGDVFGQLASAFLKIHCDRLRLLPPLRMRCNSGYLQLCDDSESIHFCMDEGIGALEHLDLDETFLLSIVSFLAPPNLSLDGSAWKSRGLAGLLLQKSIDHSTNFRRIGTFWISLRPQDSYQQSKRFQTNDKDLMAKQRLVRYIFPCKIVRFSAKQNL